MTELARDAGVLGVTQKGAGRAAAVRDMAELLLRQIPIENPHVVAERIDQLFSERYRPGRGGYDPIGLKERAS